ncbi:MAG: phosphoadenylyl-sulfate reductase [Bacteroidota bacterium]|nr:phosphoadenylyl-sulfate reductase [Bacteroidota bacterium]
MEITKQEEVKERIEVDINDIETLNKKYEPLTVTERIHELFKDFALDKILVTSSFATHSAFFLHLFSTTTENRPKIHFINTTYHFRETLAYKRRLTQLYNLDVLDVMPDEKENQFTLEHETWKTDPDLCCRINKTDPLSKLTSNFDVWVSGLMRSQNEHRKNLKHFEMKGGILRFYPILDMTPELRDEYIKEHNLPFHPLVYDGYGSVGCTHCTVKGQGREGRWVGLAKTECGLHI